MVRVKISVRVQIGGILEAVGGFVKVGIIMVMSVGVCICVW